MIYIACIATSAITSLVVSCLVLNAFGEKIINVNDIQVKETLDAVLQMLDETLIELKDEYKRKELLKCYLKK